MKLSDRVLNIEPSATLEVINKVNALKESGENVISFGAGEPDFDTPISISEAGKQAIDDGFTHYTPVTGINILKDAIIEKLKKDNNISYNRENIIVSNGAKHSLFNAFTTILNPGDEVIIPQPYWVSYGEMVILCGGVPVYVQTSIDDGFAFRANLIKDKITSKTKAIILNSPNNPTGAVLEESEIRKIADLAIKHDLIIISDEIYEKLVYGEKKHFSVASISEEVKNRTITINGVSKAYAMTGWRIGYMAGPSDFIKNASNFQGHTTSNPNSIAQKASVKAMLMDNRDLQPMIDEFKRRRDYMYEELSKNDKFIMPPKPDGAFYIFLDISKFNMRSLEFAKYVIEKEKVGVVSGIAFGMDNYVRLSYANSMEEIIEGVNRLKNL
ncbi:MAG: pyridoxal phosphate-dependent aminotransferase [Fusobacteria bacterium]|nr:pyridoxal phosphate-dependent aminotransferase [Fusobacteriota bacterium]